MKEDDFVRILIEKTGGGDTSSLGDDCAVLETMDPPLLATLDTLVRSVHYEPDANPEDVGRKLAAVNLSDIAAMGGEATSALLSLASSRPSEAQQRVVDGLLPRLSAAGTDLVGGDLSHTREPAEEALTLTVLGRASSSGLLRRGAARTGDLLAVTGPLGGPRAVLTADRSPHDEADRDLLYNPPDRLPAGQQLVRSGVRCGMDISDGLLTDLTRLLRSSGLGAVLDPSSIPIHPRARELASNESEALEWALAGGEDFELLVAVPRDVEREDVPVPLHVIGSLRSEEGIDWDPPLPEGLPGEPRGYDHFREAGS